MKRVTLAVMVLTSLVTLGLPAQARGEPELLTVDAPALTAGASSWIAVRWLGGSDVTDFRVTAAPIGGSADVVVSYPENTGTYTSLYNDAELSSSEVDFTAIRLTIPYAVSGKVQLQLDVSYDDAGKSRQKVHVIQIPIVTHTGGDLDLVTTEGTLPSDGGWVPVWFTGVAPSLTDFQLVVTDPAGPTVVYPGDGASTSLYYDAVLLEGESDFVAFRVLPDGLAPGTYDMDVEASYRKGSDVGTFVGTITVVVTP